MTFNDELFWVLLQSFWLGMGAGAFLGVVLYALETVLHTIKTLIRG